MEVAPLSPQTPTIQPSSSSAADLDYDAFLRLLIAQMQNQDPLNPMEATEYTAQLAQFSSLEQMEGVNENLVALAILQQGNALLGQLTNGSALIGQQVNYVDPNSGNIAGGVVESVKVEGDVVLMKVSGNDVPLGNVTEVLGEPEPSGEGTGEESGEEN